MESKELFEEIEDGKLRFTRETEFTITKQENGRATLSGYAMVWGAVSGMRRGGYKVRLLPNSATPDETVFALYNHNWANLLATTEDNSLRMQSDQIGLKVEIDLPDTTLGRDTEWLVANKKIRGMSFALLGGEHSVSEENGIKVRNYSQFKYDEVTVTHIPAFKETSIVVKPQEPITVSEDKQDRSEELTKEIDNIKRKKYYLRRSIEAAEIRSGINE